MSTFVKLDSGFLESSTWLDRDARDIFITALLLAVPREFTEPVQQLSHDSLEPTGWSAPKGWYGFVRASGSSLIDRAKVEQNEGAKALHRLGAPDPESRSPEYDGRRMVRVSGGWIVLNYDRYRRKDQTAAERAARYRLSHQNSEPPAESCNECEPCSGEQTSQPSRRVTRDDRDETVTSENITEPSRGERDETASVTHVDVDVEEEIRSQIPLSPPGAKRRRANANSRSTICPEVDQFVVTQATLDLATELGVDWKKHFGVMHDWSHGTGKQRLDWNATLRNFMQGSPNAFPLPKPRDQSHPGQKPLVTAQSLGLPGF